MKASRIEDTHWVRGAFGLAPMSRDRRSLSTPKTSGDYKFGDTSFGGNVALNPAPQFTRFADIKSTGLFANPELRAKDSPGMFETDNSSGSFRMGRHYSEAFDDNQHLVHFRFGVPKYCGAIAFFANMYDREAAHLAKTGEYSSILRTAGKVTGLAAMFYLLPPVAIVPLILTSAILKAATSKRISKYYYLKPTMNLYLQAVQAMADTQLLHHQLVPMWEPFVQDRYNEVGDESNKMTDKMREITAALPDIWLSDGRFDIFKAVNRYQILANYQARTLEEIYNSANSEEEVNGKIQAYLDLAKNSATMKEQISDDKLSLQRLAEMYANNPEYQTSEDEDAQAEAWDNLKNKLSDGYSAETVTDEQLAAALQSNNAETVDPDQDSGGFWGGLMNFFDVAGEQLGSEMKDGGQWVTFRVNPKGTMSDSFNNSTKEPSIASTMNSLSSSARSLEVSTSGGKTGFDFVDQAMSGMKSFLGGTLDTLNLSGLAAIYGSSQIEIPDVWESTSTSLGTQEISLQLRSAYGNDFSIFQNITLPLCFILAGCLPLSTGKQTYTSPFILEMYSRGRQNVRLGIIESVSIQRGVGNMGWRTDGKALAVDVTITVKDLSKVMHMPIIRDPSIFDDDNMYTDYMATIGGASLHQMTYMMEKTILNLNKWRQSWKSAFMPGRITNDFANGAIARSLAAFSSGTAR